MDKNTRAQLLSLYKDQQKKYIDSINAHNKAITSREKSEQTKQKARAPTKEDLKTEKEVFDAEKAALELKKSLENMKKIREGGRLGILPGSGSPGVMLATGPLGLVWNKTIGKWTDLQAMGSKEAYDRSMYDQGGSDFYRLWKTVFPRGIAQEEFKILQKK